MTDHFSSWAKAALRSIVLGALLGVLLVPWGGSWGGADRADDFTELVETGAIAGVVAGFVLHLARGFRKRGLIQHYLAWAVAGAAAAFTLLLPDLLSGVWRDAALGVGVGAVCGLAVGTYAHYWAIR